MLSVFGTIQRREATNPEHNFWVPYTNKIILVAQWGKLVKAATLMACILVVLGSNFGLDTDYPS
jgi:hypothetical protein